MLTFFVSAKVSYFCYISVTGQRSEIHRIL